MAELLVERAVPCGAGDEHVQAGRDQQQLQHHSQHRPRGGEQDDAGDDRGYPDENASGAFEVLMFTVRQGWVGVVWWS